jgi:AcrR family transcriptional regulator
MHFKSKLQLFIFNRNPAITRPQHKKAGAAGGGRSGYPEKTVTIDGVSMADIARIANVSKPTVSRVLSGSPLVTQATRDHVLEVARAWLCGQPQRAETAADPHRHDQRGARLRSHRGGRIADPFIFELLAGVAEALAVRKLDLLLPRPPRRTNAPIRTRSTRAWSMASSSWARANAIRCCAIWPSWACRSSSGARSIRPSPIAPWAATIAWADGWRANTSCGRGARTGCSSAIPTMPKSRCATMGWSEAAHGKSVSIRVLRTGDMSYTSTLNDTAAYLAANPAPDAVFAFPTRRPWR